MRVTPSAPGGIFIFSSPSRFSFNDPAGFLFNGALSTYEQLGFIPFFSSTLSVLGTLLASALFLRRWWRQREQAVQLLRQRRKARRLSQEALASKLGVSQTRTLALLPFQNPPGVNSRAL